MQGVNPKPPLDLSRGSPVSRSPLELSVSCGLGMLYIITCILCDMDLQTSYDLHEPLVIIELVVLLA